MLHTLLAIKKERWSIIHMNALWLAACMLAIFLVSAGLSSQELQSTNAVLDLTGEVPRNEQGYYRGIPGMSGGGGAWRPGPDDTVPYRLPLSLEILSATANKDGNFVFEILVRNTGKAAFGLPGSPNLTSMEKPGNKSRRVFFLQLQPLAESKPGIVALGSATTAGSTSVPGSFIRLDSGKSLKILVLASSELTKRSFIGESQKLAVKAICNEWRLDDNRFFLTGLSEELASTNTIQFIRQDNDITVGKP